MMNEEGFLPELFELEILESTTSKNFNKFMYQSRCLLGYRRCHFLVFTNLNFYIKIRNLTFVVEFLVLLLFKVVTSNYYIYVI